jgi:hypothetical protein
VHQPDEKKVTYLPERVDSQGQGAFEDPNDAENVDEDKNNRKTHSEQHYAKSRTLANQFDYTKVILGFDDPEKVAGCVDPPRIARRNGYQYICSPSRVQDIGQ